MSLSDMIALPAKVDSHLHVITGSQKAHRWKLEIPASFTGTIRRRMYLPTEAEAKAKRIEFLQAKAELGLGHQVELSRRGMSVEQAVSFALKHAPVISSLSVGQLLDQFVSHRRDEVKVSERYAATLRSYCVNIRKTLGNEMVHDVTRVSIRRFLEGLKARDGNKPASVATRNHYLETLRAVFAFARQEGILSTLPTDGVSTAKADPLQVTVLSLEDIRKLLSVVASPEYAEVAPALLLQLFAGPRRSEIPYITWDVFVGKYLRLERVKRGTKCRPVELPDVLLEWLAPYRRTEGYVFVPADVGRLGCGGKKDSILGHADARRLEDAYDWRIKVVARQAGVKLPKNVLRHTAITMRVNSTGDIAATSRWAGNSPAVILSNYLGAATPEDAKLFYAIRPTQAGDIVPLPPLPIEQEVGPDEHAVAV